MLFVIHCLDVPGAAATRKEHYPAHFEFLARAAQHGVRIVISGPLTYDDGTTPLGSLLVVEAADRATVESFNRADPFFAAGVWDHISVTAFVKKIG